MIKPRKLKFYGIRDIDRLPQLQQVSSEERFSMKVVSSVLPFRSNNYVVEDLINWNRVPDDPIYQLTFMQKGMLEPDHFKRMAGILKNGADPDEIRRAANKIRLKLNPHPAGQATANVPVMDDEVVPGIQHKYRETCLVFPSRGQTCHAYCTFCFRWPQFVGMDDLKFATSEAGRFQDYIRRNRSLSDILITGGDPMVMSSRNLRAYIEPLLGPGFEHIQSIRIGAKSVAYWPYRYVTDNDADNILRLFEKVVASGKHLAIMGHYNHWVELSTDVARKAVRRIRSTGAIIRTQSPLVKHVNDASDVWVRMWADQVRLGCIPYYMFIERNTGAKRYFAISLMKAWEIAQKAIQQVSGLARTVRGPSMSTLPGKVRIDGAAMIRGEKVIVLSFLQGRNADWYKRPFFAQYDPEATWLSDLKPAFGEKEFFFEPEMRQILDRHVRKLTDVSKLSSPVLKEQA